MSKKSFKVLFFIMLFGIFALIVSNVGEPPQDKVVEPQKTIVEEAPANSEKIYAGYYSREGNNGKVAQTTGNNTYIKFYPKNRIIRLYIPFPYAETVKPEAIKKAFDNAAKKSSGIAYIRDKFGSMEKPVVANLDTFRWVNKQVMYDCGKSEPCKVSFDDKSMTVLKPGMVVPHKIQYQRITVK